MANPDISLHSSEYDQILEKLADQYAEMHCDDAVPGSEIFPPGYKKQRCKQEFKENLRMDELGEHLKVAVALLFNEAMQHLEEEESKILLSELQSAKKAFLELSLGDEIPKILYPRLGFTKRGINAIDTIARKLYNQKEYAKAVSLNVLLTMLNGADSNYWYNLGICFQEAANYEKAILAYACCNELDPKNVGASLFSAECNLRINHQAEAKVQFEKAETLVNSLPIKDPWDQLVSSLKVAVA